MSIAEVKNKIMSMTGTIPKYQHLVLKRKENDFIQLSDKMKLIDYGVESGMVIDVYDQNPYSITKQISSIDWKDMPDRIASDEQYMSCPNNIIKQIDQKMNDPNYKKLINEIFDKRQEIELYEQQQAKKYYIGQKIFYKQEEGEVTFIGTNKEIGLGLYLGVQLKSNYIFCKFQDIEQSLEENSDEL